MDRATWHAKWFSRLLWLGILVNLFFAMGALFFPRVLSSSLELGPLVPTVWMRNAGMLLVVLSGFYALVARDPFASLSLRAAASAVLCQVSAASSSPGQGKGISPVSNGSPSTLHQRSAPCRSIQFASAEAGSS